ncbi:hypothetical protein AXG93_412s1190 [Marchantia polymorpha subsp. ruderalis]|uniref:Reverse transcriptase Ty1/copia-type domain-containing protein n=1 Tax=Marchantia polymorpha subsp. ruderalis TaxID=1480154 RepID=A0A176VMY0_MARPO|nr:hypothetical protein AXG93_412s1190 [Marchantia polymorpha subsp. ruderalis]
MRKEMKSLHDNQTWELVELPNGKRAIDCKWIYTMKDESIDVVEKFFKARLMANGFEQRKGIDYTEGFIQSAYDPCVYMKRVSNTSFGLILLVLYVDDMLISAKDRFEISKLKVQLSSEFNMKDLDPAKRILGMEIHKDESSSKLWLTQTQYAEKVLARFNMSNAKAVSTPLAAHFKLSVALCPTDAIDKELMSSIAYESAVGNIMYLLVRTRRDIAYAVGKVSRYMSNPRRKH